MKTKNSFHSTFQEDNERAHVLAGIRKSETADDVLLARLDTCQQS